MQIKLGVWLVFTQILASCSTKHVLGDKVYLTKDQAKGQIDSPVEDFKNEKIFEIEVDQLGQLRTANTLTYLGTDSGYHFMRVWNKLSYPGEINFVAVKAEECKVEDVKTVALEIEFKPKNYQYHPWRRVMVNETGCSVKKWEKTDRRIQTQ